MNYFLRNYYYPIFESSSVDEMEQGNVEYIEQMKSMIINGVESGDDPMESVKCCMDATWKMYRDYPYLYQFMKKCKMMYIPIYPSEICPTMMVDNFNNLWINLPFVKNTLKNDVNSVFCILFHEMFHIFFDHLVRFSDMYPIEMYKDEVGKRARRIANEKANICMDYEVNASMVDDGICTADFFKKLHLLYKKEYTGMTWEEILKKHGDEEYKEFRMKTGRSLDDLEMKVFEAIEKASKVLMDEDATDDEKKAARRELNKTLDELLGRKNRDDNGISDAINEMMDTKLGDIDDVMTALDDLTDVFDGKMSEMSEEEMRDALKKIEKLEEAITDHGKEVSEMFGKSEESVAEDAHKLSEKMKEALNKMHDGGLSKEEKKKLENEVKDALEDVISDDIEKEKNKSKRKERDEELDKEILEKKKKRHPFRKIIAVLNNLADLHSVGVVSEETMEECRYASSLFDPLTELDFSDMNKNMFDDLRESFDKLSKLFVEDLVKLIEDETILNKTEDDMQRLVDGTLRYTYELFDQVLDDKFDNETKTALTKTAAMKMRIIGKVLKTQKVWRVGDDFKEAYKEEMKRLMKIMKTEGEEALFKELLDAGVVEPFHLDEKGAKYYEMITGKSPDPFEFVIDDEDGDASGSSSSSYSKTGQNFATDDEIETYDGTVYYEILDGETYAEAGWLLYLSDKEDIVNDDYDTYATLAKKFEIDFPEYRLEEAAEAVFEVYTVDGDTVDPEEVKEKLSKKSDYEKGKWY